MKGGRKAKRSVNKKKAEKISTGDKSKMILIIIADLEKVTFSKNSRGINDKKVKGTKKILKKDKMIKFKMEIL